MAVALVLKHNHPQRPMSSSTHLRGDEPPVVESRGSQLPSLSMWVDASEEVSRSDSMHGLAWARKRTLD